MNQYVSTKLLDISIALSSEKDRDTLLERILSATMDISRCDGGTLYIKNNDELKFHFMLTRSTGYHMGGRYGKIDLPAVPISRGNVCACAALDNVLINVPDVYKTDRFDFSGPRRYDAMTGYKTTSMLVVPMQDEKGHVIGVLQLINALNTYGETIPFAEDYEQVVMALSSQASICLTNMNYAKAVQSLLDSLVAVLSTAIDARTPYNANHTRNMVLYGQRFLSWLTEQQHPWQFSDAEQRQFLMAVWLHDVGKLTTPREVMDKKDRLGACLERVLTRLDTIGLLGRIEALTEHKDCNALLKELEDARQLIEEVNAMGFLPDTYLERIQALGKKSYIDQHQACKAWLTEEELVLLSVRKGTLTADERRIMEEHVSMTSRILNEVVFPKEYEQVPLWAGQHHELLNGKGYPLGLTGDQIPGESRLLTILDIFEALTARDRPYKPPMEVGKALEIMRSMANNGELDTEILDLFIQSQAWEG